MLAIELMRVAAAAVTLAPDLACVVLFFRWRRDRSTQRTVVLGIIATGAIFCPILGYVAYLAATPLVLVGSVTELALIPASAFLSMVSRELSEQLAYAWLLLPFVSVPAGVLIAVVRDAALPRTDQGLQSDAARA